MLDDEVEDVEAAGAPLGPHLVVAVPCCRRQGRATGNSLDKQITLARAMC